MIKKIFFSVLTLVLCTSCLTSPSRKEVAQVYYNLGNAYLRLNEAENASSAFLKAAEYDRKYAAANFNLAKSYIIAEKYGKAIEVLNELLKNEPENSMILSSLAYCYYQLKDREKAFMLYAQILERNPDNLDARYNFAILLAQGGDDKVALRELRKIEEKDESSRTLELYYEMAKICYNSGDWSLAASYGEKAREYDEENIVVARFLLKLYNEQELYSKYLELADKIIEYYVEHPDEKDNDIAKVYFEKSVILLTRIGDIKKGSEQLKKAITAGYDDKEAIYKLYVSDSLIDRESIQEIIDRSQIITDYKKNYKIPEMENDENNSDKENNKKSEKVNQLVNSGENKD